MKKAVIFILLLSTIRTCANSQLSKNFNYLHQKIQKLLPKNFIVSGKVVIIDEKYYKYKELLKNDMSEYEEEKDNLNKELNFLDIFQKNPNFLNYYDSTCFYKKNDDKLQILYKIEEFEKNLENFLYSYEKKKYISKFYWKFDIMFKIATSIRVLHMNEIEHNNINLSSFYMINNYFVVIGD